MDEYIRQQRALGFKYRVQGSLLKSYAAFAHERGDTFIVVDTVLEWSREAPSATQKRNRLLTVRRLAVSVHADNPQHQIPPVDVFGGPFLWLVRGWVFFRGICRLVNRIGIDEEVRLHSVGFAAGAKALLRQLVLLGDEAFDTQLSSG